jgi:hypothetical protein
LGIAELLTLVVITHKSLAVRNRCNKSAKPAFAGWFQPPKGGFAVVAAN